MVHDPLVGSLGWVMATDVFGAVATFLLELEARAEELLKGAREDAIEDISLGHEFGLINAVIAEQVPGMGMNRPGF
jgi:hypothetical protein